ncbi:MAG: DNA translocase FtsK [Chloroflexi bacterium]|nr:DNA translocase FtsK [Chloroflexota bacterium]
MAKRGNKSRERAAKRPWWRGLLRLLLLPPGLWVFLAIIVGGLIYWRRSAIAGFFTGIGRGIYDQVGWGVLLIAVLVISLVVAILRRRIATLARRAYSPIRYWYRWLGAIAFLLAIWGILTFQGLGGSFGMAIIRQANAIGILRIIGLVVLGIILMAPRTSFRFIGNIVAKAVRRWQRRPAAKKVPPAKAQAPGEMTVSQSPIEEEHAEPTAAGSPQGLKQVAQDVWKKFGQSASLVTVNGWRLPPIEILDKSSEIEFSEADNIRRARLIEEALASYGVEAKVVQINPGPTVTQFGLEPGWDRKIREIKEKDKDGEVRARQEEVSRTRVKVERITSLANDIALSLAAPSIRFEAPVPGKSVVGLEVPNTTLSAVNLRGVIETSSFQKMRVKTKLAVALGKGAGGEAVVADLARMPHLLIAGATGSGKTVCLNATICSLLMYSSPDDVRLIMIDPKRVEMTPYNSIPHLAAPVIVETEKALNTLRWLSQEMDKRYQKMEAAKARNIEGYNKNRTGSDKLPYLVLVIDELADLMMAGFDEVEHHLCRLAQLARATGIHLVVATQRPSVDVITGLIKANFPTRISFAVTSQVDSRTILDTVGAEKLLGRGDMLYMPTEEAKPKRLQGCFVSDPEVERLVYFWGSQHREEAPSLKVEDIAITRTAPKAEDVTKDPLMDTVRQLALEHKQISASFLQRKLRIGKARAEKLMEEFEAEREEGEE